MSDQRDESGADVRDPDARWPSEMPADAGGITTSGSHAVPTATPSEPGAKPPDDGGHARSATETAVGPDGERRDRGDEGTAPTDN